MLTEPIYNTLNEAWNIEPVGQQSHVSFQRCGCGSYLTMTVVEDGIDKGWQKCRKCTKKAVVDTSKVTLDPDDVIILEDGEDHILLRPEEGFWDSEGEQSYEYVDVAIEEVPDPF